MTQFELRMLRREALRRFGPEQKESLSAKVSAVLDGCFDKQRAFISDAHLTPAVKRVRRRAALTTRRAGKTKADARLLVSAALAGPDRLIVFAAKTKARARELTWDEVRRICESIGLVDESDYRTNETKGTFRFSNGSIIRWSGADDLDSLRTKRGDCLFLVIIDEAQDFESSILRQLVEDIFGPGLEDLGGCIYLTGTPGIVCAGYWHSITRQDDAAKREPGWELFGWSVLDNPHMAHMKERLPELKAERKWADDNPTWLREWRGLWVSDTGALFYKFDPARNTYKPTEVVPWGHGWQHVAGWDLGKTDAMALVWWGFHPNHRGLFEAASWKKAGVSSDEVVAHARSVEKQLGLNVIARVADTGGLGALVVEEVGRRTGMWFEAAKKTEKSAHVELFNDDMLTGLVQLSAGSPLAEEMAVLPKVADWDPDKHENKAAPEDPRFANHCCDAGLYSWRYSYHYLHEAKTEEPKRGSDEAYRQQAKKIEERVLRDQERAESPDWWERELENADE